MGGNTSGNASWLKNAISHGATPDFYLDSCYVASQGQPSGWQTNFNNLMSTSAFANVRFGIAEYNNEAVTSPAGTTSIRNANDIIYNLANNRGFGAFFWTRHGYRNQTEGLILHIDAQFRPVSPRQDCISLKTRAARMLHV
jgi:hypothetical protein